MRFLNVYMPHYLSAWTYHRTDTKPGGIVQFDKGSLERKVWQGIIQGVKEPTVREPRGFVRRVGYDTVRIAVAALTIEGKDFFLQDKKEIRRRVVQGIVRVLRDAFDVDLSTYVRHYCRHRPRVGEAVYAFMKDRDIGSEHWDSVMKRLQRLK